MAFTEPFVKAVPFQTYQVEDLEKVTSISTNKNFVFFIGELTKEAQHGDDFDED